MRLKLHFIVLGKWKTFYALANCINDKCLKCQSPAEMSHKSGMQHVEGTLCVGNIARDKVVRSW